MYNICTIIPKYEMTTEDVPPIFQKPEIIPEKILDFEKLDKKLAELSSEKNQERCTYCHSKNIVKRGLRKKQFESIQLYQCNDCNRTFTPQIIKGKKYPLKTILDALSFYNTGYSLEESCNLIKEHYGIEIKKSTLADWVKEFEPLCKYS